LKVFCAVFFPVNVPPQKPPRIFPLERTLSPFLLVVVSCLLLLPLSPLIFYGSVRICSTAKNLFRFQSLFHNFPLRFFFVFFFFVFFYYLPSLLSCPVQLVLLLTKPPCRNALPASLPCFTPLNFLHNSLSPKCLGFRPFAPLKKVAPPSAVPLLAYVPLNFHLPNLLHTPCQAILFYSRGGVA